MARTLPPPLRPPPPPPQETRGIPRPMPDVNGIKGQNSERSFGFEYEYEGKQFAFHIVAKSREEAKGRLAALIHAQFVGELHRWS
jgi:hypothetical protein